MNAKFQIGQEVHTITIRSGVKIREHATVSKKTYRVRVAEIRYSVVHKANVWHYMVGKGNTWRSEDELIAAEPETTQATTEDTMHQLTTKQQRALKSIGTTHQAARYLDAHPRTLTSLVRMTLADRQYDTTNRRWKYRITSIGTMVLRQIRQDEENAPAPTVTDRIRDTYESLSTKRGAWVGLRMIRNAMPDVTRADLDSALLKMALQPGVMLDPEFNQKTLTEADRDASIRMGGEDVHLLSIGRV